MNTAELKQYAVDNDFEYLGEKQVEVQLPISDQEKIELGKNQSEKIEYIKNMKADLKEVKKEFNGKIGEANQIVNETSIIINNGFKLIKKTLPCFYDHKLHVRNFIDPDTAEIVETTPGQLEDAQRDLLLA